MDDEANGTIDRWDRWTYDTAGREVVFESDNDEDPRADYTIWTFYDALGNLELFLQAHAVLGEPHWRAEAERIAGGILADIERRGWQCGHGRAVETPGLMTGLAGIGYGLLRVAEPERVPAVLVLEPPGLRVGQW